MEKNIRNITLIIFGSFLLLLLVFTLYVTSNRVDGGGISFDKSVSLRDDTNTTELREAGAMIELSTAFPESEVGDIIEIDALINSNDEVVAVQLEFEYDPIYLEFSGVKPGSYFKKPQGIGPEVDEERGTVGYSMIVFPTSGPSTGKGRLATLTFKAKKSGETVVLLTDNSIVAASRRDDNILTDSTPSIIVIR